MALYDLTSEKALLQQIAHGNEYAFKTVFDLYSKKVFTFVVNFIHSAADAEEIVQDTFMTLWLNRATLTEIAHPRNYIYTIVRNKTYNYLAKAARNEKMLQLIWSNMQAVTINTTEEMMDARESKRLIEQALMRLSAQKREVFRLSRNEGLNHETIAQMMGLSRSRVKNIIVEVTKFLRAEIYKKAIIIICCTCCLLTF